MFTYFIIFSMVGFAIGKIQPNQQIAFTIIIVISIFWGITHKPIWGFVSFGELAFGYLITNLTNRK